jgi:CheY-like chemotaxis protein
MMSLKVLLVEDDEVFMLLNARMVVKSGLCDEPLTFPDGKEALDYLEKHLYDDNSYLVLLDINMPVMNGWEFLDSIQSLRICGLISVVMVTSSIETMDQNRARQYPQVIDYFEKPLRLENFDRIKLLPKIASIIDDSCS